jgi:hypothetical protein
MAKLSHYHQIPPCRRLWQAPGTAVARGLSYLRRKSVEHHADSGNSNVLSVPVVGRGSAGGDLQRAVRSADAQAPLPRLRTRVLRACSSHTDSVVKFGSCNACARSENAFYETLFGPGELLRKRAVLFRFMRAKSLIQYQKVDADTR